MKTPTNTWARIDLFTYVYSLHCTDKNQPHAFTVVSPANGD